MLFLPACLAACGSRVWYLWVNDLAPRDTYLPISMVFSTGQTIPYLPRRGEHHPNSNAHSPGTIYTVRTEHVLFEKQSRQQVKRSSQNAPKLGPTVAGVAAGAAAGAAVGGVADVAVAASSAASPKFSRRTPAQPKFSRRSCPRGHILRCDRRL